MCIIPSVALKVWECLNSKQQLAVFTRLSSFAKEPWLDALDPSTFSEATTADHPSDLESCSQFEARSLRLYGGGRLQQFGSGSLSRSLTGISAESEVQLSERGCSPTGGGANGVTHLGQSGDWAELCLRQGSDVALQPPCYPDVVSEQQLDCPRLGSEQHGVLQAQHQQAHRQLPAAVTMQEGAAAGRLGPQLPPPPPLQQQQQKHHRSASSSPACAVDSPRALLESQQLQGLSPTGRTVSLRIRQRSSSHNDCANEFSIGGCQKQGVSAGADVAVDAKGLKAAGEKQPWVWRQGSWVWWEWRPHDLGFLAAVVQVRLYWC